MECRGLTGCLMNGSTDFAVNALLVDGNGVLVDVERRFGGEIDKRR